MSHHYILTYYFTETIQFYTLIFSRASPPTTLVAEFTWIS